MQASLNKGWITRYTKIYRDDNPAHVGLNQPPRMRCYIPNQGLMTLNVQIGSLHQAVEGWASYIMRVRLAALYPGLGGFRRESHPPQGLCFRLG